MGGRVRVPVRIAAFQRLDYAAQVEESIAVDVRDVHVDGSRTVPVKINYT